MVSPMGGCSMTSDRNSSLEGPILIPVAVTTLMDLPQTSRTDMLENQVWAKVEKQVKGRSFPWPYGPQKWHDGVK